MMVFSRDISRFWCAVAVSGCCVGGVCAQDEPYRERQVLDPSAENWKTTEVVASAAGGALDRARSLLSQGKSRAAEKLLDDWIEDHPDDELHYEGRFLLGEALFERGHFYKAYEEYEQVVENSAGELFFKALRRETDVARAFLGGEKRIVMKIMRLSAYDEGIEILDRVWERVPGTGLGEAALRLKADYFFATGEMDLAQDEYANLAREYPNGVFARQALLRAAEAAAASFPGILFDDRALLDASERYRQVQAAFPRFAEQERIADRLVGIRERRAAKDLAIARWYERTGSATSAEYYYNQVVKDWPDTLEAAEARRALGAVDGPGGSP